jgi:tRNA(Arg) A34 adenosine deaminase TadA
MREILNRLIKKAQQSDCRYKVSAIGLTNKGDVIGWASNKHKENKPGCSLHAEVVLIRKYGRKIRTILICRTNNTGDLLPIDPCNTCSKIATSYGIEIKTIHDKRSK